MRYQVSQWQGGVETTMMDMDEIYNRRARVIELTKQQFFDADPETIGFNGKTWSRDIQAVVVDGLTVVDRKHCVTQRGIQLFNKWLRVKFGYRL